LRENHPTPRGSSNSSSHIRKKDNNITLSAPLQIKGKKVSDILNSLDFVQSLGFPPTVSIMPELPVKRSNLAPSSVPKPTSKLVANKRGTMLGSFMFMVKNTEKKVLDKYSSSDLRTLFRQLQLLEMQAKDKQDRDRKRMEDQILVSWQTVQDLEDYARFKELEDEAAQDLVYAHNHLEHMVTPIIHNKLYIVPIVILPSCCCYRVL
jgi:hypothetical protein